MRLHRTVAACVLALLGAGCNGGLIAALSDDDSSDSPPSLEGLVVEEAEVSPATVRFRLLDKDGDPAEVALFYERPGGGRTLVGELSGGNPGSYAASKEGVEHTLQWDFGAEAGLQGGFTDGVIVTAELEGAGAVTPGANTVTLGLGNDAPEVLSIGVPNGESTGVVPVTLAFADSSGDTIAARVEYRSAGEKGWLPARPAGESETPGVAIVGLPVSEGGTTTKFFWDTTADLPELEREVQVRVTPLDEFADGQPLASGLFRIDNNERALVQLDNGLVALGVTDRRGGVALPFTVRDAESDDVRVVFQWRRSGEPFPALPADFETLFALQADPAERAALQLCSPRDVYDSGRAELADPAGGSDTKSLRLAELGTGAVRASNAQLVGRELELLRPAQLAVDLRAGWVEDSIDAAVGVQPVGDGLEALVLDTPVPGTWRLLRVDLATGKDLGIVATGSGRPTALAVERREEVAFLATDFGDTYRIVRVDLESGLFRPSDPVGYAEAGAVRALAALSANSAFFCVDSELRRANFSVEPALLETFLAGLDEPFGVARDPQVEHGLILALHGSDRVVAVDLRKHTLRDLRAGAEDAFPAPRGLALDRGGSRLLVVVDEDGQRRLRALNLRTAHDLDADGSADPFVYDMADLPSSAESVGVGADDLRVVPDPVGGGLLALGGVEQRRTIVTAGPADNVVELDEELSPPLEGPRTWRVGRAATRYRGSPTGTSHAFAWDTRDVVGGGEVLLRAIPFDSELGFEASTTAERVLEVDFGARRTVLEGGLFASAFPRLLDFDRDGDLDVFVAEGEESRVWLQVSPGRFSATPVLLGLQLGPSLGIPLELVDLNGDGTLDLVHVRADERIEVYFGRTLHPGVASAFGPFDPDGQLLPIPVAPTGKLFGTGSLVCADLEGDGDLDIALAAPSKNVTNEAVWVYLQDSAGQFAQDPIRVGGGGKTDDPFALVASDLDGNGLVDLVASSNGAEDGLTDTGRMTVFFHDAIGEFTAGKLIGVADPFGGPGTTTTANVRAIAIADVDGDGNDDIVAAHGAALAGAQGVSVPQHANVFTVHWQESPRMFKDEPLVLAVPPLQVTGESTGVAVADLDADGDLDVVGRDALGHVVFFALEPGLFDPAPVRLEDPDAPAPLELLPPHAPTLADVDGDGDLDLVDRSGGSGAIELRFQHGRGVETLSSESLLLAGAALDGVSDALVEDLDGDGGLDLALANGAGPGTPSSDDLKVFHQTSPRRFATPPEALDGGAESSTAGANVIESADLDGDGDRDLVTTNLDHELLIFFRSDTGFDGPEVYTPAGAPPGSPPGTNRLIAALPMDLDTDGDVDLLTFTDAEQEVIGLAQVAPGEFEESFRFLHSMDFGTYRPQYAAAADLDGDGDLELLWVVAAVAPGASSGQLWILDGVGPNEFAPEPSVLEDGGSHDVQVADVDGDGDLDIVTDLQLAAGSGPPGQLVVHLQNGPGVFTTVRVDVGSVQAAGGGRATRCVDLDADGDLDFLRLTPGASAGGSPGTVGGLTLVEQVAPGVFAKRPFGDGVTAGDSLRVEDVDGDGELDVIVTERNPIAGGSRVRVLWGNE